MKCDNIYFATLCFAVFVSFARLCIASLQHGAWLLNRLLFPAHIQPYMAYLLEFPVLPRPHGVCVVSPTVSLCPPTCAHCWEITETVPVCPGECCFTEWVIRGSLRSCSHTETYRLSLLAFRNTLHRPTMMRQ